MSTDTIRFQCVVDVHMRHPTVVLFVIPSRKTNRAHRKGIRFLTTGADVKSYVIELGDISYKATDLNIVTDELSIVDALINPDWSESKLSEFLSRLRRLLQ